MKKRNQAKDNLTSLNQLRKQLDKKVEIDEKILDQFHKFDKREDFFDLLENFQFDELFDTGNSISNVDEFTITIFELLEDPSVQPLLQLLEEKIRSKYDRSPKYPIMARIKSCILYFFVGNGNLSEFYRTLCHKNTKWGKKLGYDQIPKFDNLTTEITYDLPGYKTIHEFLRYYLGEVLYTDFEDFVAVLMSHASQYGIRPGWRSVIDATPHESTPQDEDASWSGHYEKEGYKEHRIICADTDIPLAFALSDMTDYDGHYAEILIEQAIRGNAGLAEMWMDRHYATYDNLPYFILEKNLKVHYRINKKWKYQAEITKKEINRMYQKLWKFDNFLKSDHEDCTLYFKLKFIWNHSTTESHREAVGKYLRNIPHRKFLESPKQYIADQGLRSVIEGGFGVEKSYSMLKLTKFRGKRSWNALIALRNFIDLLVAMFRLDLGQKTNLTSWKGIIV